MAKHLGKQMPKETASSQNCLSKMHIYDKIVRHSLCASVGVCVGERETLWVEMGDMFLGRGEREGIGQ